MTDFSFNLLAEATLSEKVFDATTVTIVGMGIVFASLWVIGEIFVVLRRLFAEAEDAEEAPAPVPATKAESAAAEEQRQLVAILSAAAATALGRRVIVKRITFLNQNTVSGWAEAGRLSIQGSHNIRR